jgi:TrmH RNA methyltransferase
MRDTKKNLEMKLYGRRAAETFFKKRPQDLIRVYVTREGVFEFKQLIRYCVDQKLAYHIVEREELNKLSKATHHEDILLVIKVKRPTTLKELLSTQGRTLIVALEEVENPHNLGAILRSCAHYGVLGIIYEAKVPVAQTAAAYRVAEGGAETVSAIHVAEWKEVLELAKLNGFQLFATSSHKGKSLFSTHFPEKTILFLGAESQGLSDKMLKKIDNLISIPGTGEVESLNVSHAMTAVLTEWYRQSL